MSLAGYDRLLSERYRQLHAVARLYAEMEKAGGPEPDGADYRLQERSTSMRRPRWRGPARVQDLWEAASRVQVDG